jgi:hypothetical protein
LSGGTCVQLTNRNEAGAYFLAVGVTFLAVYLLGPVVISPFYTWLFRTHGGDLMGLAAYGVGALTWLVTLLLFLSLRAQFDGVPAIVTTSAAERPVATLWAEILAYVTVSIIVQVTLTLLNFLTISSLSSVYISLQQNGHANLLPFVAIAQRAATALAFFAIFILLRSVILSKRAQ